jgi:archaellum component FlaC
MTLGEVDGNAVRAENVLCSRRVEQRDVGVRVVYEIRAAEDGRVLVTDRLHGVDPDGFAFDPDHEPDQWAMQDETIAFKVPIAAGETATYVYGVKTDDPEDLLIRDPTIERVDDDSAGRRGDADTGAGEDRGVLAGFGTELRSAVRRVSGDAGGSGDAGAVARAAIDEEAVEELDDRIEEFERRLDSLEVERARQALEPMEERLANVTDHVETVDSEVESVHDRLDAMESRLAAAESVQDRLDAIEDRLEEVGALQERLDAIEEQIDETGTGNGAATEAVERLRRDVEDLDGRTQELETARAETTDRLQTLESRAQERGAALERVTERVESTESEVHRVAEAQERLEDRLGSVADGIERFEAMWSAMESAMDDPEEQPAD